MGFIFGLIIGAAATSGTVPPILGSIPFRCLAAYDISEADYRMCRRNSLRREIYEGNPCNYNELDKPDGPCSMERHFTWEIAGLRSLKQAVESKQSVVK